MIHPDSSHPLSVGVRSISLPEDSAIVGDELTFEKRGDSYIFYDVRTATGEPNAYERILAEAKKTIRIWDPYFDPDKCAQLFKKVKTENIRIEILSSFKKEQEKMEMGKMLDNICTVLKKNITHCKLTAFIYDKANWHDRFLIIDEDEPTQVVYLVGASMDAQTQRTKSHDIGTIGDKDDAALIITKYTTYRNVAPAD